MTDLLPFLEYPFFVRALGVGILVSLMCSFIGTFIMLKRMAFIGDTISHAAFTGIALGLVLGWNFSVSAALVCTLVAIGIVHFKKRLDLASDTVIGIAFTTIIAAGVFLLGLLKGYRIDLMQYLFGDILAITASDLWIASVLAVVSITMFFLIIKNLLKLTFAPDLLTNLKALAWVDYLYVTLTAVIIAMSIKTVGILLVTALLILPATIARVLGKSFRSIIYQSPVWGIAMTLVGLIISFYLDVASGPAIVLSGIALLAFMSAIKRAKRA